MPTLMSPPLSGIHQDHQPFPQIWLVAVNRTAFERAAHFGCWMARSRESMFFTPFQRLQQAAIGWAVLDVYQPFLRERKAETPEASITQRAFSVPVAPSSCAQW